MGTGTIDVATGRSSRKKFLCLKQF